jgi:hypothetical protein
MLDSPAALITAMLGSLGIGGFIREIVSGILKLRSGVSAKESVRKRDLVTERDYEFARAEAESRNRRRLDEYSHELRVLLIANGLKDLIPVRPRLEKIPDRIPGNPVPKKQTED